MFLFLCFEADNYIYLIRLEDQFTNTFYINLFSEELFFVYFSSCCGGLLCKIEFHFALLLLPIRNIRKALLRGVLTWTLLYWAYESWNILI